MTEEQKRECREEIERGGWHRFGIIDEDVSAIYWNHEVEIMYLDVSGVPYIGKAFYSTRQNTKRYFRGTSPKIRGCNVVDVFAWRPIKKDGK